MMKEVLNASCSRAMDNTVSRPTTLVIDSFEEAVKSWADSSVDPNASVKEDAHTKTVVYGGKASTELATGRAKPSALTTDVRGLIREVKLKSILEREKESS
jgi:hypothetical protein